MARVSVHALFVSDNPDKFAIAVTRARVDSRDFLCLAQALHLCAPRITWGSGAGHAFRQVPPRRPKTSFKSTG